LDHYTKQTRIWLEERFRRGASEGRYFAHKPIYGFGIQPTEKNHTVRMTLALSILRVLNRLNGNSILDVGGGEGYISILSKMILGYEPIMLELPIEACRRARQLFALASLSVDAHSIPFKDRIADVVIMSEVIEHLKDPIRAMEEAYRVMDKALIITSQETHPWKWERYARMKVRDLKKKHAERTFFHPDDFRALFGEQVQFLNPCLIFPLEDERRIDEAEARVRVPRLAEYRPFSPASLGIMALVIKDPSVLHQNTRITDQELVERLFAFKIPLPNVNREAEVVYPHWTLSMYTQQEQYNANGNSQQQVDNNHLTYFKKLQSSPPESSTIKRLFYQAILLFAVILRLIISPGSMYEKIKWAIRSINPKSIRKIFG